MKNTFGQLIKDYLQQTESEEELQKKIEQLQVSNEVKLLLITVKQAIQKLLGDEVHAEVKDILLYLTHSSIDVYVQTSKKISKILGLPTSNYQRECDVLDEHEKSEIKFLLEVQNGWKVKRVSKNLTSVLGYNLKDFYFGKLSYSDIIYDEDLKRITDEVNGYLKEGKKEYIQKYRVKKRDGTIITVLNKTYVEYDSEGKPLYVYGYIYNIEDTNSLERTIKELVSELEIDRKTGEKSYSKLLKDLDQYCLYKSDEKEGFKGIGSNVVGQKLSKTCSKFSGCDKCNFTILKVTNFDRLLSFCDTNEEKSTVTQNVIKLIKQKFPEIVGFYSISEGKYGIIGPKRVSKELVTFGDNTIIIGDNTFNINIVFGGVLHISQYLSGLDIYKKANLIMKHQVFSKGNGFYYSEKVEEKIKEYEFKSQLLDVTINNCLEKNGFIPYYQGIRDNKTGKIIKYEVLGRVYTGGQRISIQEYLTKLSETNKLPLVMMRILDKALEKIRDKDVIELSVNFTESELTKEFINWFILKLEEYKISTNRITIEIVETIPINLINSLFYLKELGFKIAIDDFGTGYSNMQRLLQIHPDFLKIDGSLIKGISKNKKQLEVVKTFLQIAKILQAQVIAEKIDNQDDQNVLNILGVEFTQGYLYSKPSPFLSLN